MQSSELIEKTWELYSEKKFQDIVSVTAGQNDHSLTEIHHLALLELGKSHNFTPTNTGLFNELYQAMQHYHQKNFENASEKLANWILNRGFYGQWLLDRFVDSCRRSSQFQLLFRVASKLMQTRKSQPVAEAIFYSLYRMEKYDEAIRFFDTYREFFKDQGQFLQYAGECFMKLKRYDEAERCFLALYKKLSGMDYQNRYEEYRSRYKKAMPELKTLEKKNGLTDSEWMEIGMGYLFSGDYNRALNIFEKMKQEKQKAA
ncbi:MAG: hypothetical protein H3C43_03885 [Leptonema sp. (in: Bacteria)]|nr:hypothetical protein [Leptonema sp. (in: bacteria)]